VTTATANALPVLVVDDDSALVRTLADILRLHGYEPQTSETASGGLTLARSRPPALAVVDLRLPDMDGIELVARLQEISERTEVVVLTGNASLESALAAMRQHSVDYLVKPVQVDKLLQVVELAKERWQRRQAEHALQQSVRSLEARAEQQAAVAEFGQHALMTTGLLELFNDAVHVVSETLDLPFASVNERRSDGALVLRAGVGWSRSDIARTIVLASDNTHAGFAIRRQEPAVSSDLERDDRFAESEMVKKYGIASGVTIVIPGSPGPYGVLGAHDLRPRTFTQDDVHFMQAMAHILGTAVQRHRTDAALRQTQRLEAVGRLAGGVAHDFNNMLTAITGYGEMVRGALPVGDPLRLDVDEILKAADRAAGLTRQLLAFSRQQVLQPRLVDLNHIVVDMEKLVRRLIGEDINFETSLASDLGWARADPGQIEQVLLNLCVNARDAMPEGGTLTIETANVELEGTSNNGDNGDNGDGEGAVHGEFIMLAVSDNGTGMDSETRARIFEPFFTTKADKGTGLGLATVYGIVKQSGGDVWVYSEPKQGTTLKVFLPRVRDIPDATPREERDSRPAASGTETVLVAEDEDSVRNLTQRVLERAGYSVLLARNGVEALEISERHQGPIDLLVTDMVMPSMNGRQLYERLVAVRPDLRVVYLSGYTDSTVLRSGLLDDTAKFLQKPFTGSALARRVRDTLDS
jgi:two-component system, cell cycle sensor histidine kinase and response regulator CckA